MNFEGTSTAIYIVLAVLASFSHGSSSNETSSSHDPGTSSLLTDEDLQQLLFLLDDKEAVSASKELESIKSHPNPLLSLGELLLDDEDNEKMFGERPTAFSETTTTPTTTTTTRRPTTTTTITTTTTSPSQIERREESQPSNEDLIKQLSLFNSLLQSLSIENSSTTPNPNPPLNEQQISLLNSLFGSFAPFQQATTTETTALWKRQTPGSAPSPTLLSSPSASPGDIAALTNLLTQISQAPNGAGPGGLNLNSIQIPGDHLKHFHTNNVNMDPAASNQVSSLISLLGTLGSLSQLQQQTQQLQQLQQPSNLFNFGTNNPASPTLSPNFLSNLLQLQGQASQPTPNIFGNLFSPQQPQGNQASQPFNFGNLISPSGIGGLGSVLSTMSNILSGSGSSGQPRVRGRGVDTRLGLGYRFGDAADAQVMWDIGPQLFTDPIQNEVRYSMTKKKRQDSHARTQAPAQTLQAQAQAEKEQQQQAASRRYFQIPPQQSQTRRSFHINPPTTRKPFMGFSNLTPYAQEQAIKELWQLAEMQKRFDSSNSNSFTQAELYQMERNKHVSKRASTPSIYNHNPTLPTVPKQIEPHQTSESRFVSINHKMVPRPFLKRSGPLNKRVSQQQQQQQPPTSGLFSIFGNFGRKKTQQPHQSNQPDRPIQDNVPQMSRWDMGNNVQDHRFDNFKNTNGELIMTDSNDRFYARNKNANFNGV